MRRDLSRDLEESRKKVLEVQRIAEESERKASRKQDELQRSVDEMRKSTDEMKKTIESLMSERGKTSAALAEMKRDRDILMGERDELRASNIVLKEEVECNHSNIRRLHQELLDVKENVLREYKNSEDYADDLAEESIGVYMDGFKECREKIQGLLPDFDTTRLVCSLSQPTVEEDIAEAAGGRTSADAEGEAAARSSGTEEIEIVHLDNSSSDQAEEEPAGKTAPEVAADEAVASAHQASQASAAGMGKLSKKGWMITSLILETCKKSSTQGRLGGISPVGDPPMLKSAE